MISIYFHNKRNISSAKLLIWPSFLWIWLCTNAPAGMSYKQIIATYTGAENNDEEL